MYEDLPPPWLDRDEDLTPKVFHTTPLVGDKREKLNHNQEMVEGFNQETYAKAKIALIGGGGLGSHIAQGLIRKGPGSLAIFDDDIVQIENLTRQLFDIEDIDENKAISQAKRLAREGLFQTTISAYPYRFQEMVEGDFDFTDYEVLICGVDNNPTRVDASKHGLLHRIPVVHIAVARDGGAGYCAVQEPGEACFGCMMPHALDDKSYPCNLPGIIDVLQVVAGLAVYAVDSIICERPRAWNYREIFLVGAGPDTPRKIEKDPDCALCGNGNAK